MKIKTNDTVLIISGKDRGKKGKVLKVLPDKKRIMVEGVNLVKKHRKKKSEREKGQIVEIPKPIDISNAKFICPRCLRPTRVGSKNLEGKKLRYCKKCQEDIS
jgi:large subunit ribosomal protein L24